MKENNLDNEKEIEVLKNQLRESFKVKSVELFAAMASNLSYSTYEDLVFASDSEINKRGFQDLEKVQKKYNLETINSQVITGNMVALKALKKLANPVNFENEHISIKNGRSNLNNTGTASALVVELDSPEGKVLHVSYRGTDVNKKSMIGYLAEEYTSTNNFASKNIGENKNIVSTLYNLDKDKYVKIEASGHSFGAELAKYSLHEAVRKNGLNKEKELNLTTFGSPGSLTDFTYNSQSKDIGVNETKIRQGNDIVVLSSIFKASDKSPLPDILKNGEYQKQNINFSRIDKSDHSIETSQLNKYSEILDIRAKIEKKLNLLGADGKKEVLDITQEFPVIKVYQEEVDNANKLFFKIDVHNVEESLKEIEKSKNEDKEFVANFLNKYKNGLSSLSDSFDMNKNYGKLDKLIDSLNCQDEKNKINVTPFDIKKKF